MKIIYVPKRDVNNNLIGNRQVGFALLVPDILPASGKYLFEMAVHGVGERSDGRQDHLENLVLGPDYNGDGIREGNPFVLADMKKAVDQYGILIAIPTYESNAFFDPSKVNYVYDQVIASYPIYPEMLLTGFSLGGGATVQYITSSVANANRTAYAVPVAATNNLVTKTIPGQTNLPVHLFSNDNDDRVPVSNSKAILAAINESNPAIKALITIFRKDGHGGHEEAWSLTPPKAPNGQGFIDGAENIYQVFSDIIKNGPRQMKPGVVIPPVDPPVTDLTAVAGIVINGKIEVLDSIITSTDTINFDGTKSTGYKSATWGVTKVPEDVSIYHPVITSGGGWITSVAKFPKEGVYEIELTTKNGTAEKKDTIVVTYSKNGEPLPTKQLLEKVFIPKNNNFVYVYDDGSVETKPE